jgi:NAD-dependent DNA ligase
VALLRKFGSVAGVKVASLEDMARVQGVGAARARTVFEHFHGPTSGEAAAAGVEAAEVKTGDPATEDSSTPADSPAPVRDEQVKAPSAG